MSRINDLKVLSYAYADKYGIPRSLFTALITVESNWNEKAVSPAGALGLCQGMPSTIRGEGYNVEEYKKSANIQLDFGAKHLSGLYASFKSWQLALAAYNAGAGAVKKYGGIPPYKETQNYVQKVLKLANLKPVEKVEYKTPTEALNAVVYFLMQINNKLDKFVKGG